MSHLARAGRFIDCGANHGDFARLVEDRWGLRPVLLVEANPSLAVQLSQDRRWRVENCALASRDGEVTFNLAANDEGSSILALPRQSKYDCVAVGSVGVPAKTLESLVSGLEPGPIDLLKLDIEGAEVEVLLGSPGPVLQRFSQITVEFHCDPAFGFGGRPEVMRAIARLRSLGFAALRFDRQLTNVLFVNERQLGLAGLDRVWLRLLPFPLRLGWWMIPALPAPVRKVGRWLIGRSPAPAKPN